MAFEAAERRLLSTARRAGFPESKKTIAAFDAVSVQGYRERLHRRTFRDTLDDDRNELVTFEW